MIHSIFSPEGMKEVGKRFREIHPEPYPQEAKPYPQPAIRNHTGLRPEERCSGCLTPYLCGQGGCSRSGWEG